MMVMGMISNVIFHEMYHVFSMVAKLSSLNMCFLHNFPLSGNERKQFCEEKELIDVGPL